MFSKLLARRVPLTHALIATAAVAAIAVAGLAVASIPGPDGKVKTCFKKRGSQKGVLRVIDSGKKKCPGGERMLVLNQRGPTGVTGAAGATGVAGVTGPTGPASGTAGGDLTGSYPNPQIANGAITAAKIGTPVAALVTNGAAQSIPNNAPFTLTFDTETADTAGLHDGTNPSRLTAPVAGLYQVSATAIFAVNSTGIRGLEIFKNGSTVNPYAATRVATAGGSSITELNAFGLVDLAAGDFMEVDVLQSSGAALNVIGSVANGEPRFSMYRVGPAS